MVTTRFAPSPTGNLHIGSVRTALFCYLYAKHTKGQYKLRIEDTDFERNKDEAVKSIIDGFDWIGIHHDGEIVYQSKQIERHKQVAQELLKQGKAYYCYTSPEELKQLREDAQKQGKVFKFKSPWRETDPKDFPKDIQPVVRIKAPLDGGVTIYDTVQGEKTIPTDALDDFIILRSDGTPTYMFAVVVDDNDMSITHVIRGTEHYNNAFRQRIVYDAMNWKVPTYCHVPVILGRDKAKLSKRHGAASIMDFKELGYLPEALRNYLLRLCWSHGDDEIISDEQAIEWFNLESIGKSPAMFDYDKLNSVNKHYLRLKSNEELFTLCHPELVSGSIYKSKCLKAMDMIKDRAILLTDIKQACKIYQDNFAKELDEKAKKALETNGKEILKTLLPEIEKIQNFTADNIKETLKPICESKEWKMKEWTQALRVAITFSTVSPGGIFEIMEILGKEEIVKRINDCIK